MRLVETCSCGASIDVGWTEPKSRYSSDEHFGEAYRAEQQIKAFRLAHKPCRVKAASSTDTKPKEDA